MSTAGARAGTAPAPVARLLAGATPVAEYRTGLQRVRVLRTVEGHLWCHRRGPDAPPEEPAPERTVGHPVLCTPERVGDEDVFRVPGPDSLAATWNANGPSAAETLLAAGRTAVRAVADVQVAVGRGHAPPPDTLHRLQRWCSGADLPGDAGRLRDRARRLWPDRGVEELAGWARTLAGTDRPVALHGGLSLGTVVSGPAGTVVLTGSATRAGAAELDPGGLLGELVELQWAGGAAAAGLVDVRRGIADAWPHRTDAGALARAAVLRVAVHAVDFAAYVGWVPDLVRYLELVARLAGRVRRDPDHFVRTVLAGT